jgi:hypothetical protein
VTGTGKERKVDEIKQALYNYGGCRIWKENLNGDRDLIVDSYVHGQLFANALLEFVKKCYELYTKTARITKIEKAKPLKGVFMSTYKPTGEDLPYFVEVDKNGCSKCGHGREYTIIGPEDCALSVSWEDKEESARICEWLNEAYYHGRGK